MTIKRCDRCGKLIRSTGIPRMTIIDGVRYLPGMNIELCKDCVESLRKWVNRYEDTRTENQRQS